MNDHPTGPQGASTGPRTRGRLTSQAAGGRWGLWLLRAMVWAVLAGAALLLLRQVSVPSAAEVVDVALDERLATDVRDWPVDEARAAAARVVTEALTLDDEMTIAAVDEPTATADYPRTPPLLVPASGAAPARQTVKAITPGRVEILDAHRATVHLGVRVDTLVTQTTDEGQHPETTRRRHWRWLAVPVVVSGEQVVASPALVDMPPPATPTLEPPALAEIDSQLTAETAELAEAIFAAWAGDSRAALDAVTDGSIDLLAGDMTLVEVTSWRVAPPDSGGGTGPPQQLTGLAEVTWTYGDQLTSTQTYTVELERDGQRWRATGFGPAHPTPPQ